MTFSVLESLAYVFFCVYLFCYTIDLISIFSIAFGPIYIIWTLQVLRNCLRHIGKNSENPFFAVQFFTKGGAVIAMVFFSLKMDDVLDWPWIQILWVLGIGMLLVVISLLMILSILAKKLIDKIRGKDEIEGDLSVFLWVILSLVISLASLAYFIFETGETIDNNFENLSFLIFSVVICLLLLSLAIHTIAIRTQLVKYVTTLLVISEQIQIEASGDNQTRNGNTNHSAPNRSPSVHHQTPQPEAEKQTPLQRMIPRYLKVITGGAFYGTATPQEVFLSKLDKRKAQLEKNFGRLGANISKNKHHQDHLSQLRNTLKNIEGSDNETKFGSNRELLPKTAIINPELRMSIQKRNSKDNHEPKEPSKVVEEEEEYDFSSEDEEANFQDNKNVITLQNMQNSQEVEVKKSKDKKPQGGNKNKPSPRKNNNKKKGSHIISKEQAQKAILDFQNIKSPNTIKQNFQGGRRKSIDLDDIEHKELLDEQSFISEYFIRFFNFLETKQWRN